jgi:hypothetical protein
LLELTYLTHRFPLTTVFSEPLGESNIIHSTVYEKTRRNRTANSYIW